MIDGFDRDNNLKQHQRQQQKPASFAKQIGELRDALNDSFGLFGLTGIIGLLTGILRITDRIGRITQVFSRSFDEEPSSTAKLGLTVLAIC